MTKRQRQYSPLELKIALAIMCAGIAVFLYFFLNREKPETAARRVAVQEQIREKERQERFAALGHPDAKISDDAALATCQREIKRAARDPETAVIPDVGWMRGGADWRFLWNQNSHMVRMRNGLGLEVAVVALCVVDEVTGKIKLLTLDGKTLIAPN